MPYSSRLANYILYTPFDSKSVVGKGVSEKLTQEVFIKQCYVKPQFQKDFVEKITDDNFETYDYIINYDQLIDIRNQQKKDYLNFYKWMNSKNNLKIYTISGNAGTGKTTFIRRLEYENKNKNWIIFDVVKAKDFVDWFNGIETNIDNFNIPYNKMYAIVLDHLCNLLFNNKSKNIDDNLKKLKHILNTFKNKFRNPYLRGNGYFDGLIRSMGGFTSLRKSEAVLSKAALYTKQFFLEQRKKHEGNPKLAFRDSLDILLIAYCCVYDRKDHIIVFDNLERFIAHDEIYNNDLDQIRRELSSYAKEISSKSMYYQCNFKFMMCMRTSSSRMCGVKLHSADELPSDLNITDWFLIDDIIQSKLKWYEENIAKTLDVETLSQIICDLRTCNKHELTGLQLFIHPLFNENIRLITDFMGGIVEKASNKVFIDKYIDLWKENTSVSRFAARSIIRGLIYQELDNNDNLFHHLQLYTEYEIKQKDPSDDDYGLSYVRKILTILYNANNEVTLEQIISNLCGIREGAQEYLFIIISMLLVCIPA